MVGQLSWLEGNGVALLRLATVSKQRLPVVVFGGDHRPSCHTGVVSACHHGLVTTRKQCSAGALPF